MTSKTASNAANNDINDAFKYITTAGCLEVNGRKVLI
jgi:hypothetical protein